MRQLWQSLVCFFHSHLLSNVDPNLPSYDIKWFYNFWYVINYFFIIVTIHVDFYLPIFLDILSIFIYYLSTYIDINCAISHTSPNLVVYLLAYIHVWIFIDLCMDLFTLFIYLSSHSIY